MSKEDIEIKEGYTRVSEIVGWFKANELAKIDPDTLRKKAQLGTNVHAAIAGYDEGVYVPLDEKEMGYFQSFKTWRDDCDLTFISEEKRLYCDKLKITGAVDCIAQHVNGDLFLIDYKTTVKEDPIGWPLQGAFYHHLATKNGLHLAPFFSFIQLHKEGKAPKIYNYSLTPELRKNMMTCYDAFHIWNLPKKERLS